MASRSILLALTGIDPDQEILRLEQILRDGIRPPIIGVQSVRIPLADGSVAIVVHIPKSWNPPHQVGYRFYGRGTNGKYQLDVDELRAVFSLSASAAERIKSFRIERITKIVAGDTPLPLEDGAKMITHIFPLSAFTSRAVVDLTLLWSDPNLLVSLLQGGGSPMFNVDGLLLGSRKELASRYVQVFRDGCIEVIY